MSVKAKKSKFVLVFKLYAFENCLKNSFVIIYVKKIKKKSYLNTLIKL